ECDRCRGVAPAPVEVALRAAEVAEALLARRGDEVDRPARRQPATVDLLGDGKHDRKATAVVVDSGTNEARAVSANRKRRAARENGVEVRAHDNRWQAAAPRSSADHVGRFVDLDVAEPERAKTPSHEGTTLVLFTGRRGDLGKRDLRMQDRRV